MQLYRVQKDSHTMLDSIINVVHSCILGIIDSTHFNNVLIFVVIDFDSARKPFERKLRSLLEVQILQNLLIYE